MRPQNKYIDSIDYTNTIVLSQQIESKKRRGYIIALKSIFVLKVHIKSQMSPSWYYLAIFYPSELNRAKFSFCVYLNTKTITLQSMLFMMMTRLFSLLEYHWSTKIRCFYQFCFADHVKIKHFNKNTKQHDLPTGLTSSVSKSADASINNNFAS